MHLHGPVVSLAQWLLVSTVLAGAAGIGCTAPAVPTGSESSPAIKGGSRKADPAKKSSVGSSAGATDLEDPEVPEGSTDAAAGPSTKKDGSAVVVDLGAVTLGKPIVVDVPDTALGFNVVVRSGGKGEVGIERIESPTGVVLVDAFKPKHAKEEIGSGFLGVAALSVPQDDDPESVAVRPGKWKFTFAGEGTGARAQVRIQTTDDGRFHGGALDVHVYIPEGLKMSGSSNSVPVDGASENEELGERFDRFYQMMEERLGIGRGEVTFHGIAGKFTSVGDFDDMVAASLEITKGKAQGQALHLVLTNSIGGGDFLGFSTGIPGAAGVPGTTASVVIAALYDDSNAETDAFTWLHEMGHFIGLNHTSEADATAWDMLSDTPQCKIDRSNGSSSSCPDDGNLMSTGSNDGSASVTKGQIAVYRGSPIYRAHGSNDERSRARPHHAHRAKPSTSTSGVLPSSRTRTLDAPSPSRRAGGSRG